MNNRNLIEESLLRQNELTEEKKDLLAYNTEDCDTSEDCADRAKFLRLIRKRVYMPSVSVLLIVQTAAHPKLGLSSPQARIQLTAHAIASRWNTHATAAELHRDVH